MDDPREDSPDPLDALVWLVEHGWAIAVRGVYGQTKFAVRAVRGDRVLVLEGRELGKILRLIREDAKRAAQTENLPPA